MAKNTNPTVPTPEPPTSAPNQPNLEQLLNQVSRDIQGWQPHKEEGADQPHKIAGVVTKLSARASDFSSEMIPVIELDPQDGDGPLWRIIAYPAALQRELAEARPRLGDAMAVQYTGQVKGKKGDYPAFRVAVAHAEADPVADAEAEQARFDKAVADAPAKLEDVYGETEPF